MITIDARVIYADAVIVADAPSQELAADNIAVKEFALAADLPLMVPDRAKVSGTDPPQINESNNALTTANASLNQPPQLPDNLFYLPDRIRSCSELSYAIFLRP
jgi:hypothetical protein